MNKKFRLAIYCKSFVDDFGRLKNLLRSHSKFAPDMPLIVSIPKKDEGAFRQIGVDNDITLIFDDDYSAHNEGLYGWFQQQICKLSIHHTNLADAYLSVDSDAYLLGPIDENVFYSGHRKRIVYSSLFTKYHPGNSQLIEYVKRADFVPPAPPNLGTSIGFDERLRKFRDWLTETGDSKPVDRGQWINFLFNVPDRTCLQPGQILHSDFLNEMEQFFESYNVSLSALIKLIPWEYNWYGSWVSAFKQNEAEFTISPIIHFASASDVADARANGLTAEILSKRFKVIQMAARHFEDQEF